MKQSLQNWWQQLAPRERMLIGWGGAGLVAALGYAYVWMPVDAERHKLRNGLPALRVAAAQVRAQGDEVLRLKAMAVPSLAGAALLNAVEQAARELGSSGKPPQFGLLDERRVSANWPVISFDAWTALAAKLQNVQHVRLESASVDALSEPGMVRVQAVFASGG